MEQWIADQRKDILDFVTKHTPRSNWHEPDEQGITAKVIGDHLDNACVWQSATAAWSARNEKHGEFTVILFADKRPIYQVHLADLLADYARLAKGAAALNG